VTPGLPGGNGFPRGYVRAVLGPREPVLDRILERSLTDRRMPTIQIDDNAGRVLQLLTRLHRPRRVIEIGTLFGYSTVHIARGLPPGGRITSLESDPARVELARENLALAGLSDRAEIVLGDARAHLAGLAPQSISMIFIDADKASYPDYLKLSYPLLERGGLLIADDAFAQGDYSHEAGRDDQADLPEREALTAPDPSDSGETERREATAIRSYARAVARSPRLFSAFIGTEHGMLISHKED
jgi:predicted O-methyltransferase YrrM